ncbi:hypothetical protein [Escherichia coli]|nr:hypothetical protein [Escherichia coli]EHJ8285969.1 hypothetical protein [Escherichia coli]EHK2228733.1 hypothetical protein [Escherichia coli]EHL4846190.1 hypothetical protein [Escherichia coli]EHY3448068.1 hypothetical protein [Escherichia coli]EIN1262913.1 hypothetical protein [Escherichia coli]
MFSKLAQSRIKAMF